MPKIPQLPKKKCLKMCLKTLKTPKNLIFLQILPNNKACPPAPTDARYSSCEGSVVADNCYEVPFQLAYRAPKFWSRLRKKYIWSCSCVLSAKKMRKYIQKKNDKS